MRHATVMLASLALLLGGAQLAGADEATATLAIQAPATADGMAAIPFNVTLTMQSFACTSDGTFTVALSASSAQGTPAAIDPSNVTFTVPAGTYLLDAWSGDASARLMLSATGPDDITIVANLTPDDVDCFGAGGTMPGATANATVHVAPASQTSPPPVTSTPATNETNMTTNETPVTNSTSTNSTNASGNGSVDQLPSGSGYVGDYQPTESRGVPAAGAAIALSAGVVVAIALRRKR